MEKEDVILECFVLKGRGVDWLAVIYLEKAKTLKAFSRKKITDRSFQIQFLSGSDQKKLSEELARLFQEGAGQGGPSPVHLEYPGGIREGVFIQGMREAERQRTLVLERAKN
jgi:hypothetical protein